MITEQDLTKFKFFSYHPSGCPSACHTILVSFIGKQNGLYKFRRQDTLNEIWLSDLSKISYSRLDQQPAMTW